MSTLPCTEFASLARSRLALFNGSPAATTAPSLSPSMSLSQFFRAFVAPIVLGAKQSAAATVVEYSTSVAYWVEFTGDPPLEAIDDFVCAQFLALARQIPGRVARGKPARPISSYTLRKHVANVQAILNLAGPRSPHCRKGQRLIVDVPFIDRPTVERSDVAGNFTLEELSAILSAAGRMTRPTIAGVAPPQFWRSLVVVAYNTGERRRALLSVRFADLSDGVLRFPRGIRKGGRKSNAVKLNAPALEAIERIRGDRERIFPYPNGMRQFSRQWKRLLRLAGIAPARMFGIHGLRKSAATALSAIDPLAAQWALGHADFATTNDHYLGGKGERVASAFAQIPQPSIDDQRKLF